MAHKQELLQVMQETRAELEAVVAPYHGRLDTELGHDWRVRDVLAHIATWERMAARKLTGAPLPLGEEVATRKPWNLNTFNQAMRDLWRTRTDDEILAEFAAAYPAIVAAVESASEDDCAPRRRVWKTIDEDSAGHYHHHFPIPDLMALRWPKKPGRKPATPTP